MNPKEVALWLIAFTTFKKIHNFCKWASVKTQFPPIKHLGSELRTINTKSIPLQGLKVTTASVNLWPNRRKEIWMDEGRKKVIFLFASAWLFRNFDVEPAK